MDLQRIRDLELQVGDMREDNARLDSSVDHLARAVEDLTETVNGLRDTMNRGRGAAWVIGGIGALGGGVVATLITKWFGA
jgi:uncharacterized protein YlxW (UPF0749 family)